MSAVRRILRALSQRALVSLRQQLKNSEAGRQILAKLPHCEARLTLIISIKSFAVILLGFLGELVPFIAVIYESQAFVHYVKGIHNTLCQDKVHPAKLVILENIPLLHSKRLSKETEQSEHEHEYYNVHYDV